MKLVNLQILSSTMEMEDILPTSKANFMKNIPIRVLFTFETFLDFQNAEKTFNDHLQHKFHHFHGLGVLHGPLLGCGQPLGRKENGRDPLPQFPGALRATTEIFLLIKVVVEPLICPWIKFEPVCLKGSRFMAL